jgi:hypothetical protein
MTSILSRCFQRVHIGHLTLLFSLLHREKKDKFNSNVCRKSEQFIEESLVFHIVLAPRLDYDFDCLFFFLVRVKELKKTKVKMIFGLVFFFFHFQIINRKGAIILVARVHIPYFCFYYYFILQRLRHLNHGSIDFFFSPLSLSLSLSIFFISFFPPFASSSFFLFLYLNYDDFSLSLLYTQ